MSILHLLFPPICVSCGETCATKVFCPSCWLTCELPDPVGRCRHCFEVLDERGDLCVTCRQKRKLPIQRAYVFDPESPARMMGLEAVDAMASFALFQWIQLEWPMPDAVIPMPDSVPIAAAFASFLNIPLVQALKFTCDYREDRLEDDQILLLFDISNPLPQLQKAASALSEAFPKRIYLLSLFPYADSIS